MIIENEYLTKKRGFLNTGNPLCNLHERLFLAATDGIHLGAAVRADALSCWLAIFHCNGFSIFHFFFCFAFNAISLYHVPFLHLIFRFEFGAQGEYRFFFLEYNTFTLECTIGFFIILNLFLTFF